MKDIHEDIAHVSDAAENRGNQGKPAPKVSIGLPVYNGADYLEEALASILAQTFTDFELIISDNASTDRTADICRDFAARDSRIVYHRQPKNLGACRNYDLTFHMSRGEYFKWAAHDDLLAPTFLERHVEELDAHLDCNLVYSRTIRLNASGARTGDDLADFALDNGHPASRLEAWIFPWGKACTPVFGLIRRSAMAKTGLHGNYPGSDRVFLGEMALGGKARAIDEGLFLHREHEDRSVHKHADLRARTAWYTGVQPKWPVFRTWRLLGEYLRGINRADMPLRQKMACHAVIFRWAVKLRKDLIKETLVPFYLNGEATRLGRLARQTITALRKPVRR